MNWNSGFSAAYYAAILDADTFREIGRLEITGGKINHKADGLRESADIDCVNYEQGTERWIRIYLDARQGRASAHVPLFTGLACSPSRNIEGLLETSTLQCYSVLKPAQDILLDRGYYVIKGQNGAAVLKELLSVTPAPVVITAEAPTLRSTIIAENGETRLTMADRILGAMGWRMTVKGDGTIQIGPEKLTAVATFDPLNNDCVEPKIKVERDWYECPNVFRAMSDDMTAVARDDDPGSPLSTVGRGREIWAEDTSAKLNSGEDIAAYARRRLKELQSVALLADYDRRYNPDVNVGDLIRLHFPKQGLDGVFRVEAQTVDLGYGAKVNEEVTSYEQGQ